MFLKTDFKYSYAQDKNKGDCWSKGSRQLLWISVVCRAFLDVMGGDCQLKILKDKLVLK